MPSNENTNTDHRYLQGLKTQDEFVLKEIYNSYFPSINNHIINNSGLEEDAQDVFHDALIVIYRKSKENTFELTSSFHTYLFAICKNIWLKKLNRKKRESGVTIEQAEVLIITNEVEKTIETTEKYALYREKFQLLGKDCQKLLLLYFEKKNMVEIASEMGFSSEGYSRKRKFQCKEKLTKLIKEDDRFNELK